MTYFMWGSPCPILFENEIDIQTKNHIHNDSILKLQSQQWNHFDSPNYNYAWIYGKYGEYAIFPRSTAACSKFSVIKLCNGNLVTALVNQTNKRKPVARRQHLPTYLTASCHELSTNQSTALGHVQLINQSLIVFVVPLQFSYSWENLYKFLVFLGFIPHWLDHSFIWSVKPFFKSVNNTKS